jgi:hypothetical protein
MLSTVVPKEGVKLKKIFAIGEGGLGQLPKRAHDSIYYRLDSKNMVFRIPNASFCSYSMAKVSISWIVFQIEV